MTIKNNIYFTLFIIILFIVLLLYFKMNFLEYYENNINDIDNLIFHDENNNIINHELIEKDEQDIANQYIDPDNVVLELGARYGTDA
jgi:hypothetical protein